MVDFYKFQADHRIKFERHDHPPVLPLRMSLEDNIL